MILLTGGCGFIGSHICVELLKQNYQVVIIDFREDASEIGKQILRAVNYDNKITNKDSESPTSQNKLTIYKYDLQDINKIDEVFNRHKITSVIHLAALKSVGESVKEALKYYTNNITTTLNLLNTMEKYECYNLLFSSSGTVYGTSKSPLKETSEIGHGIANPYGQSKYMTEVMLKDLCKSNSKWNITSLRYFNPIGSHPSGHIGELPSSASSNIMPIILNVINNKQPILQIFGYDYEDTKDGTCVRDYIHVVDVAEGHVAVLNKMKDISKYEVYNLGTGNGVTVLEIVNTFMKVNNVDVPYKFTDRREGDLSITYADTTKVENELKWKTKKTLEDMCLDTYNFNKITVLKQEIKKDI